MKTIIYTSIYSNLWKTEYGGRPSRGMHYKQSLLNILNLSADKYVCFTSYDEINDLRDWFYVSNNVNETLLEIVPFDLKNTKYFDLIKKLKNIEEIKNGDRCFEIQYNKFFWLEYLTNIKDYDRVYWFDAGLSHSGIFPKKYSIGDGQNKYYKFSLFNSDYLKYLNNLTNENIVLVAKSNFGPFYWSRTLPNKYYVNYDNSVHIIGGFFGGKIQSMIDFKLKFELLLIELLENEIELHHEELLMSCIYQNNKNVFTLLRFDDWYDRNIPNKYPQNTSYFYNIFEIKISLKTCVATLCIERNENQYRYINTSKNLLKTYLTHTNFDILLLTNKPNEFSEYKDGRVIIVDYNETFIEPILSGGFFNMHLKRLPIKLCSDMNYDIIYYHDCDCFIVGWDNNSFITKCHQDFDVAFVSHANPQLGDLRKNYQHFQHKIDTEFSELYYDELDLSPNPAETRVLFKNNEKLKKFISFWDIISSKNQNYNTYHDGVYFGTSAIYANMKMIGVTPNDCFSQYCRISHGDKILNYFGIDVTV